jgi:cytoskeletal protein CcmA (bactofilin family)
MNFLNSKAALSNNILLKDAEIDGNLSSLTDLHLEGILNGDISCKAKIYLSEQASIKGNVISKCAEISGKVKGNINCVEVLDIKSTAIIEGDILCGRLILEDGASIKGNCSLKSY